MGKDYIDYEWTWKFLWVTIEKEMQCLEKAALEQKASVLTGSETQDNLLQ